MVTVALPVAPEVTPGAHGGVSLLGLNETVKVCACVPGLLLSEPHPIAAARPRQETNAAIVLTSYPRGKKRTSKGRGYRPSLPCAVPPWVSAAGRGPTPHCVSPVAIQQA